MLNRFIEAFGIPDGRDIKVKGLGWRLADGLDVYVMRESPPSGRWAIVYLPLVGEAGNVPLVHDVIRATGAREGRAAGSFKFKSMARTATRSGSRSATNAS